MKFDRETNEVAGRAAGCILVTGGAGFIGSNFVLDLFEADGGTVVNLDKLTYAGNPANLAAVQHNPAYTFVHGDICDANLVAGLLRKYRPGAIVHFAAESHVDRSIVGPEAFLRTNIDGTFTLLQAARSHYDSLTGDERERFRFLHVSRRRPMRRTVLMLRRRLRRTTWCGRGCIPMGCRLSLRTARTTMGRTSFRKNLFR
jgi:dTDP-glucose 4,6-dehydratase